MTFRTGSLSGTDQQEEIVVYALGHSDAELERLVYQSRFFGELTEEVFHAGGLGPGMRVLDIGCGAGDVSFLAAGVVGTAGSVLGVDRSPEAVSLARQRAATAHLANVSFEQGDLTGLTFDHPFDALVGRLVLLYQPDPAATLAVLRRHLRSGGLIIMQEMDMSTGRSVPLLALAERCVEWIRETFRRSGSELDMGSRLLTTFVRAGLPAPRMLLRARIEAGPDSLGYAYLAQLVRSLLPMMEQYGVTTPELVQPDTLETRLRDEAVREGGVIVFPSLIGAWAVEP
jgi:SAM-dependent methyltransferase